MGAEQYPLPFLNFTVIKVCTTVIKVCNKFFKRLACAVSCVSFFSEYSVYSVYSIVSTHAPAPQGDVL